MEIVKAGIHYVANGTNGYNLDIHFCHKDKDGKFVEGITNEELANILYHRFRTLVEKQDSKENVQCLVHAREIIAQLKERHKNKLQKKTNDNSRNGISVQASSGKN